MSSSDYTPSVKPIIKKKGLHTHPSSMYMEYRYPYIEERTYISPTVYNPSPTSDVIEVVHHRAIPEASIDLYSSPKNTSRNEHRTVRMSDTVIPVIKKKVTNYSPTTTTTVVKSGNPQETFVDMQKNMEDELERRRKEWEHEVEKMQSDFFQLKTMDPSKELTDRTVQVAVKPSNFTRPVGSEIIDISNSRNLYTERSDGTRVYRLRFDVRGFEPEEVNVKAEGKKLLVQAKHEEEHDSGKNTKQFNRQMDIPDDVDPDKIVALMSVDGILCVEAPVEGQQAAIEEPQVQHSIQAAPSSGTKRTQIVYEDSSKPTLPPALASISADNPDIEAEFEKIIRPRSTWDSTPVRTSSSSGSIGRFNSPLMVIIDGQKKLKLSVDIGSGFEPDDVAVKFNGFKISVAAKREETAASGRTSRREFSKEFELPEDIDPGTLRAALSADGKVFIGASGKYNMDHNTVLTSIAKDMPPGGRSVTIEL